jgi:hypothetical protein
MRVIKLKISASRDHCGDGTDDCKHSETQRDDTGRKGGGEVKLTTKQNDELVVRKGRDKEGVYVELLTEDSQYILTQPEAVRLGNALIEAAQPKKRQETGK